MAIVIIPKIPQYRGHLNMVLSFIFLHISLMEMGEMPSLGIEKITTKESIEALQSKTQKAGDKKVLKITIEDSLLFYACFVFMNKILVSKYDEFMITIIIGCYPNSKIIPDFKTFRDDMIFTNNHLIANSEDKLKSHRELNELKERLSEIQID